MNFALGLLFGGSNVSDSIYFFPHVERGRQANSAGHTNYKPGHNSSTTDAEEMKKWKLD